MLLRRTPDSLAIQGCPTKLAVSPGDGIPGLVGQATKSKRVSRDEGDPQGGEIMIEGGSMELKKERKTAASIRRVMERTDWRRTTRSLAVHRSDADRIEGQIEMQIEMLIDDKIARSHRR